MEGTGGVIKVRFIFSVDNIVVLHLDNFVNYDKDIAVLWLSEYNIVYIGNKWSPINQEDINKIHIDCERISI